MSHVDHLWTGWRAKWVQQASNNSRKRQQGEESECILCELKDKNKEYYVIARNEFCFTVLNLYPYANGHMMVIPLDHYSGLDELSKEVRYALMDMTNTATESLRKAYDPDGINVGINMGEGSGAGIPEHLHIHVLPRWVSDSGAITTTANVRVLPETLESSYDRIYEVWPESERV